MFITQQSRIYFQTKYADYSYLTLQALFWFKIVPITAFTGYSLIFRRKFPIIFPIVWTIAANVVIPNPDKWFFRVQQQKERFMNSATKFKKYTYTRMTFDQFSHCYDIARVSAIQKAERINGIAKDPSKREQIKQKAKQIAANAKQTLKDKNQLLKLKDKLKEDVKEAMRQKLEEMKQRVQNVKGQKAGQVSESKSLPQAKQVIAESKGPQTITTSENSALKQAKVQKVETAPISTTPQAQIHKPAPLLEQGYKQYALHFFVRYFKGPKIDQDAAILGTYFLMRYSIVGTLRNIGLFL